MTQTDPKAWARSLVTISQIEMHTLIERLPERRRISVGSLKAWSPKDEVAHVAYWIEVFVKNIRARRAGAELIDTRPYLAMNDAAWEVRKNWPWAKVERALDRALSGVDTQLKALATEDLIDTQRLTIEPQRASPRPLINNVLYELMDHPLHHLTGLYRSGGATRQIGPLLSRVESAVRQPGTSKWAASTLRKLKTYRESLLGY